MAHLRRGPVFRAFMGWATCRICGTNLRSQERTDGVWAWPDGLEHYVEAHDVRLPEAFVAAAQRAEPALPSWVAALGPDLWLDSGESVTPVDATAERAWVVEESTWLDWAAANTPARPARDAVTLDEARAVCGRFSHPAWPCELDEANGRWVVRLPDDDGPATRMYLHACSATVLGRRLLSVRLPDPTRILDLDRSEAIAAEYDGAWGAARVVAGHDHGWLVWVKRPETDWPTQAVIEKAVEMEPRPGWSAFYPDGGRAYVTRPPDEIAWRWLLTCERSNAEHARRLEPREPARWWLAIRRRLPGWRAARRRSRSRT